MRMFMLIGVRDSFDDKGKATKEAQHICSVSGNSVGDAASRLRGASYSGVLRHVSISKIVGSCASNYAIFRPGRDTSTVVEAAIARLDGNVEQGIAFGDYLNRYTDWVLVEVASVT